MKTRLRALALQYIQIRYYVHTPNGSSVYIRVCLGRLGIRLGLLAWLDRYTKHFVSDWISIICLSSLRLSFRHLCLKKTRICMLRTRDWICDYTQLLEHSLPLEYVEGQDVLGFGLQTEKPSFLFVNGFCFSPYWTLVFPFLSIIIILQIGLDRTRIGARTTYSLSRIRTFYWEILWHDYVEVEKKLAIGWAGYAVAGGADKAPPR
ncbi:hypothetical protein BT96DRAFT_723271 [Gymnopus androsaceus JB14]|uniref:Uncharacterized protein n=1 Tax=Gymnopus androsaceus JB14 TaxID=1447944 RepID=A0A6A4HJ88_9AGAR|nr:hypothetical protein BT96DRAFT_723271 [Gymnopus androsaceus JB14]